MYSWNKAYLIVIMFQRRPIEMTQHISIHK